MFFLVLVHQIGPKSGPSLKQGLLKRTEIESGEPEVTQHPILSGLQEHTDVQNRTQKKEV